MSRPRVTVTDAKVILKALSLQKEIMEAKVDRIKHLKAQLIIIRSEMWENPDIITREHPRDKREELARLEAEHDEIWEVINSYAKLVAQYTAIANRTKAKGRLRLSYALKGMRRERKALIKA